MTRHSITEMMGSSTRYLRSSCEKRPRKKPKGMDVIICWLQELDWGYTSKTCGECGNLHQKLGGSKDFLCPNCHRVLRKFSIH